MLNLNIRKRMLNVTNRDILTYTSCRKAVKVISRKQSRSQVSLKPRKQEEVWCKTFG